MSYKILSKFIKDVSFEIPNAQAFIMLEKEIPNYTLNFDIKSNPFKNNIIEVNTVLRISPNQEVKHKILSEITCTALVSLEKKFEEMEVIAQWPDVVGRQIASHTHAVSCEGGKLFVEVDSASWRQELFYMKVDILKRLNHGAGQEIVQDIILTNTRR